MPTNDTPSRPTWDAYKELFYKTLDVYSVQGKKAKAIPMALRLSRMIEQLDPRQEAMYGMAGRALIAEIDGDLGDAIRYWRQELAAVKLQLTTLTPEQLDFVQLDAEDYSDRLDRLACVYLEADRYDDALAALAESEAHCKAHGLKFDGRAIRADVKKAMRAARPTKPKRPKAKAKAG